MYDFKGVNHIITYIIYYYSPKFNLTNEFKSILNPNYKNNFNDYNYYNKEHELDDDGEEFSRDKLLETYKRNELLYEDDEDDEVEDIVEEV